MSRRFYIYNVCFGITLFSMQKSFLKIFIALKGCVDFCKEQFTNNSTFYVKKYQMYNTFTFSNNKCKNFIFVSTFSHNQSVLSRCKQCMKFTHNFSNTLIKKNTTNMGKEIISMPFVSTGFESFIFLNFLMLNTLLNWQVSI